MADATKTPPAQGEAKNKPVESFRDGPISAAIFTDEVTNKAGEPFTVYNVSLRRSYRLSSGEWKDSRMSIPANDLLKAARALEQCNDFVAEQKASANK